VGMPDISMERDLRGISIQKVGVRDVHIPLQIRCKDNGYQEVLGRVDASIELPHHYRGTHMSRFMEILTEWSEKPISGVEVRQILEQIRRKLRAERANVLIRFKYFIPKRAPVSKSRSGLDYDRELRGQLAGEE